MAKSVGMAQAKSKLADLVGRAAYKGERIVLERRGRPVAVLIGMDEYNRLRDLERRQTARGFRPRCASARRNWWPRPVGFGLGWATRWMGWPKPSARCPRPTTPSGFNLPKTSADGGQLLGCISSACIFRVSP